MLHVLLVYHLLVSFFLLSFSFFRFYDASVSARLWETASFLIGFDRLEAISSPRDQVRPFWRLRGGRILGKSARNLTHDSASWRVFVVVGQQVFNENAQVAGMSILPNNGRRLPRPIQSHDSARLLGAGAGRGIGPRSYQVGMLLEEESVTGSYAIPYALNNSDCHLNPCRWFKMVDPPPTYPTKRRPPPSGFVVP
ncbi:hypothetical protein BJ170DRAFT_444352 [Xylariales sp. AK1849]|nr:hypothetical protein BJ170DRAFT_444352 [Xylariales sp. AK1849]